MDTNYSKTLLQQVMHKADRNVLGSLWYEIQDYLSDLDHQNSGLMTSSAETAKKTPPHVSIVIGHSNYAKGADGVGALSPEYDYYKKMFIDKFDLSGKSIHDSGDFTYSIHNRNKGLTAAYAQADSYNPLFTVELHYNASVNPIAQGNETLYVSKSGHKVASLYNRHFMELGKNLYVSDLKDRGIKKVGKGGRGWYNMTRSKYPSILIEPFFGSNSYEARYASSRISLLRTAIMQAIGKTAKDLTA